MNDESKKTTAETSTLVEALPTDDEATSNLPAIVGGVIGGLLLIACIVGAVVVAKKRSRATADEKTAMGAVHNDNSGEHVGSDSVLPAPTKPEWESARASHYASLPEATSHYASPAEFEQMNQDANQYLRASESLQ